MKKFKYDLNEATQHKPNTVLTYGSEFRPWPLLEPLLQHHHHWHSIKDIITRGATYPLKPITESERLEDISFMLERGNHKSAKLKENDVALEKAFSKEVGHHWVIPFLPSTIPLIPGASVTPLGVATQWSINERNERVVKRRPTHDCSFPGPSGLSCNVRVLKEQLDECMYGHALSRFITGIHSIRSRHPKKKIWMNKTDMDAAYRRIHANMQSATTCITVLQDLAYLLGRLPFGSAPAPTLFSSVSDSVADVAQDLSLESSWDPSKLHSSFNLDFAPNQMDENITICQADPLLMSLPERDIITDNFIDDLFQCCLDEGDNPARIKHAIPLVLETFFRNQNEDDASPRNPIINMKKHQAEGRLEETKVVLGWLINTRLFRVFLTEEKSKDWIRDIDETIQKRHCSEKLLETMIGRFNHTGFIVIISKYFLSRLRYRLRTFQRKPLRSKNIRLAPWDIKDLHLWKTILTSLTSKGISINNINTVLPSAIVYSDACEWGLGGFSTQGPGWRLYIPIALHGRGSINFLEFLGAVITIMLSINNDNHTTAYPHILAFTDNSSALGWMHHSTFDPVNNPQHDSLARHLADYLVSHEATLFSQHVPGEHNVTADCLSRDFHLSDTEILSLLQRKGPASQVLKNLHLKELPKTISSWALSMLESLPLKKGSQPRPKPSSLALSDVTKISSQKAASPTPSLPTCQSHNDNSSFQGLPIASALITMDKQKRAPFLAAQSRPPSRMWFRPSGRTFGLTPLETTPETKAQSSHAN